jgi:AcrR family transcriptional regulator
MTLSAMSDVATPTLSVTEQRILEASTKLFYERGYHATTMRDIAAAVGIKAGSLYNHYSGKEEILLRICLETSRELYDGVIAALDGVDDVEEQLRAFVIWHVTFHAEHREASRVTDTQLHYLEEENRLAVVELRDTHEERLRQILQRGARQRRWRSANLRVISIGIETMCTEVDAWYRADGELTAKQIAVIYADFIRRGLGGR